MITPRLFTLRNRSHSYGPLRYLDLDTDVLGVDLVGRDLLDADTLRAVS